MKKLLIIFLCMSMLLIPTGVSASSKDNIKSMNLEEALKMESIEPVYEKYEENDKQVPVYFFMGQGEERSVSFLNYVNSIYDDYGSKFNLIVYEVGSNSDNSNLIDNVIDYIHSDVNTFPMIVIGDTHFTTWTDDLAENFVNAINSNYQMSTKIDNVADVLVKYYRNYDLMIWIIIILVFAFIGGMVYVSLKDRK